MFNKVDEGTLRKIYWLLWIASMVCLISARLEAADRRLPLIWLSIVSVFAAAIFLAILHSKGEHEVDPIYVGSAIALLLIIALDLTVQPIQ
jgi:hypothetical protein